MTERLRGLSWYRAPMLWLALALPACTVVAGLITYSIAAGEVSDAEPDVVRRVAQVQTTDLEQDESALRMGLSAELRIDAAHDRLSLHMAEPQGAQSLQLSFIHRTRARLDRTIWLQGDTAQGWSARLPPHRRGEYTVSLRPADARWRLVGTLGPGTRQLRLRPLLADAHG